MSCTHIQALLSQALDQPLAPQDQAEVDDHIVRCPACAGALTEQVLTVQILREIGDLEAAEAPPPVAEHLIRRVLEARAADGQSAKSGRRAC